MTRYLTAATCVALLLAATSAPADDRKATGDVQELVKEMTPPADSKQFAMKAAEGGLFEVKLAELAQQKAQSQEVKQLAQQIQQDHQKANDQLKQAVQGKNLNLPNDLSGLKQKHYQAFQQLEGKAFENAYLLHMVKAHLHDIMMFRNESKSGSDQEIKQWASQTLTHLQHHANRIAQVAQSHEIPVEALAVGSGGAGEARPAGSRQGPGATPGRDTPDRPGSGTTPDRPGSGTTPDRPGSGTTPDRPGSTPGSGGRSNPNR